MVLSEGDIEAIISAHKSSYDFCTEFMLLVSGALAQQNPRGDISSSITFVRRSTSFFWDQINRFSNSGFHSIDLHTNKSRSNSIGINIRVINSKSF